jgi:hypothetical protein
LLGLPRLVARPGIGVIYSKQLKLVFIKGKKVAGTSVEILLSALCGPDDIITPITPIDEKLRLASGGRAPQNYGADPAELRRFNELVAQGSNEDLAGIETPKGTFRNHSELAAVVRHLGPIPDDYVTFVVERSPYYKVLSAINMHQNFDSYRGSGARMVSGDEQIAQAADEVFKRESWPGRLNIDRYKLRGRVPPWLKVIKYDTLAQDLRALLIERGVANPPDLPVAKEGRRSETLDLRKLLRPEHIARINSAYAEEFETFGFPRIDP